MHNAIKRIIDKRSRAANQSQYDVTVCVRSVAAARSAFDAVPVKGTVPEYGHAVKSVLSELAETYYDSEGEYTSKGLIGDVSLDVSQYIDSQLPDPFAHIDKKEARKVLIENAATYIGSEPKSTQALKQASIKFNARGQSEMQYYLEITYEITSDTEFTMIANIYDNDQYRDSILEELWFLVDEDLIVNDKGFADAARNLIAKAFQKLRSLWP